MLDFPTFFSPPPPPYMFDHVWVVKIKTHVEFHLQLQNSFSCSTIWLALLILLRPGLLLVSTKNVCDVSFFRLHSLCPSVYRLERKGKQNICCLFGSLLTTCFSVTHFANWPFCKLICVEFLGLLFDFSILFIVSFSHLDIFAHFFCRSCFWFSFAYFLQSEWHSYQLCMSSWSISDVFLE